MVGPMTAKPRRARTERRGGAKGDSRKVALPAAAAGRRAPSASRSVAARVVSTEGTVGALVDALHAGGRRRDDDAESHALLAHAASAVGNIAAHPASAGLIAPAPRLVPGLARLLTGARPEVRRWRGGGGEEPGVDRRGEEGAGGKPTGSWGRSSSRSESTSAGERHAAVVSAW